MDAARRSDANPAEGTAHGYIKAKDKERLEIRLRRIEGQVRGVRRMVDEEAYCVDVLTQIASVVSALEKVGTILLKDHVEHCVRESIEKGEEGTVEIYYDEARVTAKDLEGAIEEAGYTVAA